jgi:hypothetical protein
MHTKSVSYAYKERFICIQRAFRRRSKELKEERVRVYCTVCAHILYVERAQRRVCTHVLYVEIVFRRRSKELKEQKLLLLKRKAALLLQYAHRTKPVGKQSQN